VKRYARAGGRRWIELPARATEWERTMDLDDMKAKRTEYDEKLQEAVAEFQRLKDVILRLQGARAALDDMIAAEEGD